MKTYDKRIADILKTKLAVLRSRYERYKGIHEIGEATNKQIDLMLEAKEDLDAVEFFIKTAEKEQEDNDIMIKNREKL